MTYEEVLAFWYGRVDFEKKSAKPTELKLERMRYLLEQLNQPQDQLRILHIAGTKGKGSSAAMLAQILQCQGYHVGLFTSPHLLDVSERIQIDRMAISKDQIISLMESTIIPVVQKMEAKGVEYCPTFFEISTALGWCYFASQKVDFAVVEVGLGGRLDSTNICQPMLTMITNISFDHMAQLGNTIEAIAAEKAGIIKSGVPVICSAENPLAQNTISQIASEKKSICKMVHTDFYYRSFNWDSKSARNVVKSEEKIENDVISFVSNSNDENGSAESELIFPAVEFQNRNREKTHWQLSLWGNHQACNAAGVLAAIEELREQGIKIGDEAIRQGLATVAWHGRMEVIRTQPLVILDCAHNVASMVALVETLHSAFPVQGLKQIILAISNDKQIDEMLAILFPEFDVFHLCRYGNNPRCTPPDQLAAKLLQFDPQKKIFISETAREAWEKALTMEISNEVTPDFSLHSLPESRKEPGRIVITGSVFLAGEILAIVSA